MNILVTGAEGYIGSVLTPYLVERGHHVGGLDTGFYLDGALYDGIHSAAPCIRKDVRRITKEDLGGFDAVVHLAELSNDPLGQLNPRITYDINHRGAVNLARKCKVAGIQRFVYTSSCSVYGMGSETYQTEQSPTSPQTAYARCKVLVERDVSELADDDFSPTFLRNATAYGPSRRMRFDLVLNNLAGWAWTTKEIRMTSDGTPWRPLVHVLDICEAIACALDAPREVVHDQIFNVGDTKENYQVKEIAEIVARVFPGCKLTLGVNNRDNRTYRVCFDKINTQLPGFRCRRDSMSGVMELLELFERINLSRETFEFRTFTRIKQLEHLIKTRQIDDRFFWK
ncbi:MAG: NAD-dependent epimerase/dehydratase family protein [Candidatus Methylomirabilales bacterium]